MMRRLLPFVALMALSGAVSAQVSDVVTETVSVNYVMVPFTVLGSRGVPITDLGEKEVSLFVDGLPVARDLFEKAEDAPVSFAILLDGSGSMALAGKMEAARAAIATLVAHRRPGDDFALYVFDHLEAKEVVPFTEDPGVILRAMSEVKPYGKTAFFDAVATMPERSELGKNPTRAIILLSDGIDNASKLTRLQLPAKLQGVPVPIYALGLRPAAERQRIKAAPVTEELSDIALLEEIASLTGGKLFLGTRPEEFAAAAAAIDRGLRVQYLIGFSPTGKGAVKYRRISLKLAGRVQSVRVRAGYRGTEPPVLRANRKNKRSERKRS
jgi:VWFA-related protein